MSKPTPEVNHEIVISNPKKSVSHENYEIDLVYNGKNYPIIRNALSRTMKNLINSKDKSSFVFLINSIALATPLVSISSGF